MTKIVDLSVPLENEASEPFPPKITYKGHEDGAKRLGKLAGVDPGEFPDGMGLATDRIELTTHSGTHIDAPWHYGPTSGDKRSRTVDEVPLEWCVGPGVRLDFTWKEHGTEISVEDLVAALEKISYEIQPNDIILIQTGADKYWGTDKYLPSQCGLSAKGTDWLLDKGVRCIGIDAWGLDRPVKDMARAHKDGQKDALWPSHFHGRNREYLQIEKLANLDLLPVTGFTVSALPVKIKGASAAWCRAVALLEV
ncbi:MAG: cyclase family protein [Spirochaetota bacterium]